MRYLIGRSLPSDIIRMATLLRDSGYRPSVPQYERIVRSGKNRERVRKLFQVLPGFIFLQETEAMDCRTVAAAQGMNLSFMKKMASAEYASCSREELEPMWVWAHNNWGQDDERPKKTKRWSPPALSRGDSVSIRTGPFSGFPAIIVGESEMKTHLRVEITIFGRPTPADLPKDILLRA